MKFSLCFLAMICLLGVDGADGMTFRLKDVKNDTVIALKNGEMVDGLSITVKESTNASTRFYDVTVSSHDQRDRALLLSGAIAAPAGWGSFAFDPYSTMKTTGKSVLFNPGPAGTPMGLNGRHSRYPFAAISNGEKGVAVGVDLEKIAFFRAIYDGGREELAIQYDFALTKERRTAEFRFVVFDFDGRWNFRGALEQYCRIFPAFRESRVKEHGMWVAFASIKNIPNVQDFGIKFKEGFYDDIHWEEENNIMTYCYHEPNFWWYRMKKDEMRKFAPTLEKVKAMAAAGDRRAQSTISSGMKNKDGTPSAMFAQTYWADGCYFQLSVLPGIKGENGYATAAEICWNEEKKQKYQQDPRWKKLDGEFIDCLSGYMLNPIDYSREHMKVAELPLIYDESTMAPGIYKCFAIYEFVRMVNHELKSIGKYTMGNHDNIWVSQLIDIPGTETNWIANGNWKPLSSTELMYHRVLAGDRPYGLLQNTMFDQMTPERAEKYMMKSIAFGIWPCFFTDDQLNDERYFSKPARYERDRELFKKYVPHVKVLSEAGWRPVTLAASSHPKLLIERFGDHYFTVFNESQAPIEGEIRLENRAIKELKNRITNQTIQGENGIFKLTVPAEHLVILEIVNP